jgi:hypothetical protein
MFDVFIKLINCGSVLFGSSSICRCVKEKKDKKTRPAFCGTGLEKTFNTQMVLNFRIIIRLLTYKKLLKKQ